MYRSYLTSSTTNNKLNNNANNNLLSFETFNDYEKISKGYCELIIEDFFSSFSNDYDAIFISKFVPIKNPLDKKKNFFIKFDDIDK